MKLLYYLAAIGMPHLGKKLKILSHNLLYIHSNLNHSFSIAINCYSNEDEVYRFIKRFKFLDKVYFHYKHDSVLTELWFTNPNTGKFMDYDEILFILDDVSIDRLNISFLRDIRTKYGIDLISPSITGATHSHMASVNSHEIAITNCLEVYCILMTPRSFRKYLTINSAENKWLWGVDHLFGHFGIKTAIYRGMSALHMIPAAHNCSGEAERLMDRYLNNNGFTSLEDVKKKYPVIKEIIII